MQNVTDRMRNPFGMRPDCRSFVPGYGDANADFHVVGDHPGVHGGVDSGVPFTGEPWSPSFLAALRDAGLLEGFREATAPDDAEAVAADGNGTDGTETDESGPAGTETDESGPAGTETDESGPAGTETDRDVPIRTDRTYFSYLHMCVPDGSPSEDAYADMERFFDAELRAIAAHVLLPVGARATDHVLRQYTARAWKTDVDMDALHAEEILGSGWLVLPIKDPVDWDDGDADRLVESLRELTSTDFRRESDLGRFVAGSDPHLVR